MVRRDVIQLLVNYRGRIRKSVTKETNLLILGNNEYCKTIKDDKSNKLKKAESLILKSQDLKIIPEDVFYDLVLDDLLI